MDDDDFEDELPGLLWFFCFRFLLASSPSPTASADDDVVFYTYMKNISERLITKK